MVGFKIEFPMVVVEEIVVIVVVEEMIGKRIDVWFSVRAIFILLRTSLRSRYRGGGVKEPSEGEMFFAGLGAHRVFHRVVSKIGVMKSGVSVVVLEYNFWNVDKDYC